MGRFTGVLGNLAVLAAAWLFSTDRRKIRAGAPLPGIWKFTFTFLVLRFSWQYENVEQQNVLLFTLPLISMPPPG